jgi:hypothetical protein
MVEDRTGDFILHPDTFRDHLHLVINRLETRTRLFAWRNRRRGLLFHRQAREHNEQDRTGGQHACNVVNIGAYVGLDSTPRVESRAPSWTTVPFSFSTRHPAAVAAA